ncbi:copper chaperone PCu(A)C [Novosphingobium aquimarinum]|uniref:copper chaperone PCu(A)C n=1 Tax=Novosphingobium aquimarinum TaxID=2682494 RepID=UPI001E5BD87A|nr:copper chaperone PCu(A)C [Novosphingobium aquimarinum]
MYRPNTAQFLLCASLVLALGACQQSEAPAPAESETVAPMPDAKPGLVGGDGRLVLPAVEGRPGVAYFVLHNGSARNVDIAAVHIDGVGRAEMHNTIGGSMKPVDAVPVEPGKDVTFAPGSLHVMAFDIDPALVPGGAAEMTLTFTGGDKLSMPIKIEAIGSGMQGMAGMDHEGSH